MTIDFKKIAKRYLFPLIASVIVTIILNFFLNGIPIFGVPKVEEISQAQVTRGGLVKVVVDKEDLEIAHNLVRSLSYKLGSFEKEQLIISMTFKLKDGSRVEYGAGENVIYINGSYYKAKNNKTEQFINLSEAVFFFSDLVNQGLVS